MPSAAKGISTWQGRLRVAAMALRALFTDPDAELATHLLQETRNTLPVLAVFQLCALAAFSDLARPYASSGFLMIWGGIGLIFVGTLVGAYLLLPRLCITPQHVRRCLNAAPFVGAAISVFWIATAVFIAPQLPYQVTDLSYVFALGVMFMGLLCAIRLLATALQFLVGAVAIATVLLTRDFAFPNALVVVAGLLSVLAFSAMVILTSISLRRRFLLLKERKRDLDLIKLLLNDLGTEIKDWHWETDDQGRLLDHSPHLAALLGVSPDELKGSEFELRFFGKHAPQVLALIEARGNVGNESVAVDINGSKTHWLVSARPITTQSGQFGGYRGVARDVTVQRQQEEKLSVARDIAQQANDTKSQFLAVISHELRTPINAIVGFSEVLSAGQGEHLSVSARREYLGTILESAKHLQGLINEILESTRIERGALKLDEQPNDAAELVEVVAKIVRDQATQGKISVVARVIEDVEVMGDLTRLKQVILNILSNAIKFSPEGGVVNMDMSRERNGDLAITVRDAGIGISDADAERVFEPFVQADIGSNRRFGGMGLGLSIARRIARLHGGELTLKGQVGGGTEARFTLPAARVRWPRPKMKSAGGIAAA